ncbi:MAG TPA: type II toxin-antitoxin system VapB family antitoxin [Acidobacteriaceae bacterium]
MYIVSMALHINNPEVERDIRDLAAETGETITQTIGIAVRELKLKRRSRKPNPQLAEELMRIAKRIAAYPPKDNRTPDEIIGYDEIGLPR